MGRDARKLLSEPKIRRGGNEIDVPNVAINIFENIGMFGQRAADTEGYYFGI